jgi:hypothetical protein
VGGAVENETKFLDAEFRNKIAFSMFEDLSSRPVRETPPPDSIIVTGAENGGIVIRQRGAADENAVVIPPEQAESLIAAIRRHLNK